MVKDKWRSHLKCAHHAPDWILTVLSGALFSEQHKSKLVQVNEKGGAACPNIYIMAHIPIKA
jgi:hypothetical protein